MLTATKATPSVPRGGSKPAHVPPRRKSGPVRGSHQSIQRPGQRTSTPTGVSDSSGIGYTAAGSRRKGKQPHDVPADGELATFDMTTQATGHRANAARQSAGAMKPVPVPDVPPAVPSRRSRRPRSGRPNPPAAGGPDSSANETDEDYRLPAMDTLSISAPSASTSSDVWQMPIAVDGRKEALNWQQQSMASHAASPLPPAKTKKARPRPKSVAGRVDDSAAAESPASSALTWQQELMRGQDLPAKHSTSFGSALEWPGHTSAARPVDTSPTKRTGNDASKRQPPRQKSTPTASAYEPFELEDVLASSPAATPPPAVRAVTPRSTTRSAPPVPVASGSQSITGANRAPASHGPAALARYAGPAFTNSPSPHLLPTPSRFDRRTDLPST